MKKHGCVFFNTQDYFFYGFQLINFNKIELTLEQQNGSYLSISSNSSKAVTKQKCYKNLKTEIYFFKKC